MNPKWKDLEAKAEKATPGPWESDKRCVAFARQGPSHRGDYESPYGFSISGEYIPAAGYLPAGPECDDTAAFIAAANPLAIKELIGDLDKAIARAEEAEAFLNHPLVNVEAEMYRRTRAAEHRAEVYKALLLKVRMRPAIAHGSPILAAEIDQTINEQESK